MSDLAALGLDAFHHLEARRRARRLQDWNIIDALYKAYMTALIGGLAVVWLSNVVAENAGGRQRQLLVDHGPAAIGVLLAVSAWTGIRSGQRGGPLTVTTATVRTVLLAPVDRGAVLRPYALRQLRVAAFGGAVAGAAAGVFALRRFGGAPLGWLVAGAALGAVAAVLVPGTALVVAGRRVPTLAARAVVAVAGALAGIDALTGRLRSPLSWAGAAVLVPMPDVAGASGDRSGTPVMAAGLAVLGVLAVAPPLVGLVTLPGVSIERLERRSRLVTLLRFAATVRDLRAAITFRRLLGQESARARPWLRLHASRRLPIWHRDWQGVLRWPAVRFVRLAALGAAAGVATAAAASSAPELAVVAAAALYLAAAEAAEGAAQEADHPTLASGLPVHREALWIGHLAVPTVIMTLVGAVAVASATALVGLAALPAMLLVPPAAAVAVATTSRSAFARPDPVESMRVMLMDPTGASALTQLLGPPIKAGSGAVLLVVLHRAVPTMTLTEVIRVAAALELVIAIAYVGYHGLVGAKVARVTASTIPAGSV